jgi:glycerol-3-phosphate dehydrogenase (NAD(P)+)
VPDIAILGAGVMGSAMAVPAAAAGHKIALIGTHLDTGIIRSVAADRWHPGLSVTLPQGVAAHDWTEADVVLSAGPDLVVLGVASAGVAWAIERLAKGLKRPVPILMITKGLSASGSMIEILPKLVKRELSRQCGFDLPVMAIGGPCIAGELAALRDTCVVITGESMAQIEPVLGYLKAPFYHATASTDMIGVEFCAAFKNFYAIAVGSVIGRLEREIEKPSNAALMHNLAASAFTQALGEMAMIVTAFGGDAATVGGLAGAGDLYVTCQAGRNGRMGRLLGLGYTYSEAKADHMPDATVEGANLATDLGPTLQKLLADGRLPADAMPMTCALLDAVCHDAPLVLDFGRFYRTTPNSGDQ